MVLLGFLLAQVAWLGVQGRGKVSVFTSNELHAHHPDYKPHFHAVSLDGPHDTHLHPGTPPPDQLHPRSPSIDNQLPGRPVPSGGRSGVASAPVLGGDRTGGQRPPPDPVDYPGDYPSEYGGAEGISSPYWGTTQGLAAPAPPHVTPEHLAPLPPSCREAKGACNVTARYRSVSGRCNNLGKPQLGTPGQPMPRMLPPHYDAGLMRRTGGAGGLLPDPRSLSVALQDVSPGRPSLYNQLLVMLGQFIDHDLTLAATLEPDTRELCRECDSWTDPRCAPIPVPPRDPHFAPRRPSGQPHCLPFTRTAAVAGRHEKTGQLTLEQVSLNTAFLDLSTVYGSDRCTEEELRQFSGGLLVEVAQGRPRFFLPPQVDGSHFLECRTKHGKCFFTGDERNNEQVLLMLLHVLFFWEHNRFARRLTVLNPHWDDERLYQEARRINIAQYQHLVYQEFLPRLLGPDTMAEYQLSPQHSPRHQEYDHSIDPTVLNEFATAAFRVGHTLVAAGEVAMMDPHYLPLVGPPLHNTFHDVSMILEEGTCDRLMRGILASPLKPPDLQVDSVLTNQLFEGPKNPGQDLFARNIARGRDHGLAPYLNYLEACRVTQGPIQYSNLQRLMSPDALAALTSAYHQLQDIDLFPGGLAEKVLPGALVGPTFACIIAFQFLNTRRGDRFWYTGVDNGLSARQLEAIRGGTSMARVICNSFESEEEARVPKEIFSLPSRSQNPLVRCDRVPRLDLRPWLEAVTVPAKTCTVNGRSYAPGKHVAISPCLSCHCQHHGQLHCEPWLAGCYQNPHDHHCHRLC